MKIEEIQKQEFYFDEPLLEYVGIVADECWRTSSNIPYTFARRYVEGKIKTTSKVDKYLGSEEVMRTLKALGLNISKFWYLCLCIKDYVEDRTKNALEVTPTHRKVLTNLMEDMDKMNPAIKYDAIVTADKGGELTFKLEGEKHKITITDKQTLTLINIAIGDMLERYGNEPILKHLLDGCEREEKTISNLSTTKQIYLFDKYLSRFLDMLDKMDESKWLEDKVELEDGRKTSKDKKLLISRMIFILELSTDENYYREFDENGNRINKLKNTLNWYKKKTDIPTRNRIYWM